MKNRISIIKASSKAELLSFSALLKEYAELRNYDEALGDIQSEIFKLPGEYAPPDGCILLAKFNSNIAGCTAIRKLSNSICEMKRLFVRDLYHGNNIGHVLITSMLQEARNLTYKKMRLDTHPWMEHATKLYISLGFKRIDPYNYNPTPGIQHFEIIL